MLITLLSNIGVRSNPQSAQTHTLNGVPNTQEIDCRRCPSRRAEVCLDILCQCTARLPRAAGTFIRRKKVRAHQNWYDRLGCGPHEAKLIDDACDRPDRKRTAREAEQTDSISLSIVVHQKLV